MDRHPMQSASTSASKARAMPSYAQATAASSARSKNQTPIPAKKQPANSPKRITLPKKPTSPSIKNTYAVRHFDASRLSTTASRNRAKWNGPFRFMDLLPEIRNIIYDYYLGDESENIYEVTRGSLNLRTALKAKGVTVPSPLDMLCVPSKQIRDEFSSFFFCRPRLTLCMRGEDSVRNLLCGIGSVNLERLLYNDARLMILYEGDTSNPQTRVKNLVHFKDGKLCIRSDLSSYLDANWYVARRAR